MSCVINGFMPLLLTLCVHIVLALKESFFPLGFDRHFKEQIIMPVISQQVCVF